MAERRDETPGYWFPAKKIGWGWGFPCAWQGWVAFFVYMLVIGGGAWFFPPTVALKEFILVCAGASLVMVGVAWAKGEPPR